MKTHAASHLIRFNVLLTPEDAERFNAHCEEYGYKKSTLIARLVRNHLDKAEGVKPKKRRPKAADEDRAA